MNNGQHIVAALLQAGAELEKAGLLAQGRSPVAGGSDEAGGPPDGFDWFVPALQRAYSAGLHVDM
eukprot:12741332-Alexandrium_andersonii.AAC.1